MLERLQRQPNAVGRGDINTLRQQSFHTGGYPTFIWHLDFAEVFFGEQGGFDIVIKTPPYLVLQDGAIDDAVREDLKNQYNVASFKLDLYHFFLSDPYAAIGRRHGSSDHAVELLDEQLRCGTSATHPGAGSFALHTCGDVPVFEEASVDNAITIIGKRAGTESRDIDFSRGVATAASLTYAAAGRQPIADVLATPGQIMIPRQGTFGSLLKSLRMSSHTVGDFFHVKFGMQLRDRREFTKDVVISDTALKKPYVECLTGKDIFPFGAAYRNQYALFDRKAKRGGCWDPTMHQAKNKVVVRQVGKTPRGFRYRRPCLPELSLHACREDGRNERRPCGSWRYLDSSLARLYWVETYYDQRHTFPKIKGEYLKEIPIPDVKADVAAFDSGDRPESSRRKNNSQLSRDKSLY